MIMKRIIFALTTALMLCTLAQGKNRTVTENDSLGNKQRVIELKDTVIDGKAVTDTLSIMTLRKQFQTVTQKVTMITSIIAVLTISAGISDMLRETQSLRLQPLCSFSAFL